MRCQSALEQRGFFYTWTGCIRCRCGYQLLILNSRLVEKRICSRFAYICGHCLFQVDLWSWGIHYVLEMKWIFVRFLPTTVAGKRSPCLPLSFGTSWSVSAVAHCNVSIPPFVFFCCGSFPLDLPRMWEDWKSGLCSCVVLFTGFNTCALCTAHFSMT